MADTTHHRIGEPGPLRIAWGDNGHRETALVTLRSLNVYGDAFSTTVALDDLDDAARAYLTERGHTVVDGHAESAIDQGERTDHRVGRPQAESDGDLLTRLGTDGREWALEFVRTFGPHHNLKADIATLTGWFANAIETGRTAGMHSAERDIREAMARQPHLFAPYPLDRMTADPEIEAMVDEHRRQGPTWASDVRAYMAAIRRALDVHRTSGTVGQGEPPDPIGAAAKCAECGTGIHRAETSWVHESGYGRCPGGGEGRYARPLVPNDTAEPLWATCPVQGCGAHGRWCSNPKCGNKNEAGGWRVDCDASGSPAYAECTVCKPSKIVHGPSALTWLTEHLRETHGVTLAGEAARTPEPKAHAALLAEEMLAAFDRKMVANGIEGGATIRSRSINRGLFEVVAEGIITAVDEADKQRTLRSVWRATRVTP